jgi:hypothetical protein
MRRADTLLAAYTDAEIDEACRAMRAADPGEALGPTSLSLLVLARA